MTTDLETMANKADALLAELTTPETVVVIRGMLNDAGINGARLALAESLTQLADAQAEKRRADNNERDAREKLQRVTDNAEWTLEPPEATKVDGKTMVDGREVVSWVAADKAAWKKREAAKQPDVKAQTEHLRQMEHESAVARDALTVADKRLSARRADLDAAIATLNALVLALPARSR